MRQPTTPTLYPQPAQNNPQLATLVDPTCAKRFLRHFIRQPALLNRHYSTSTGTIVRQARSDLDAPKKNRSSPRTVCAGREGADKGLTLLGRVATAVDPPVRPVSQKTLHVVVSDSCLFAQPVFFRIRSTSKVKKTRSAGASRHPERAGIGHAMSVVLLSCFRSFDWG